VQNTASVDRATLASCLVEIGGMSDIEVNHQLNGIFAIHDTSSSGVITWKNFTDEWIRIQLFIGNIFPFATYQ
jgi:hypothetical protein